MAARPSSDPARPRVKKQVKLNTDESPSIATEYGIRSIPTVMIFKGGQKLDTVIGAVAQVTLTGTIEKYLLKIILGSTVRMDVGVGA